MFNKRLQHDFIIPNAGLHRVYLLEESDTGGTWPVIKGEGEPVKLPTGNPNNKIYTPILPGILTWRIVIRNQAERDVIDAVFDSIEGDYRVEYYQVEGGITENLIWRGDLLLDQYNEDLRGFPGFVEIVASDLGKLQGLNYLDIDGFPHTGRESQLQIIKNCVQLLGYDLGFACSDAIFEDTMDGDPTVDDPMLQAYADNAWYYPVDSFGQTRLMSAWDVLRSQLVSKACRIRQWGGRWYIEQIGPGVAPIPLPESNGNFLIGNRNSSTARLYNFDGSNITLLQSLFTGGAAVIGGYLPPDGSIVVLGRPGNWRKFDSEGNMLWERQLTVTATDVTRTRVVYSRYGYYAAVSTIDAGVMYVSCVDDEGNLIYELPLAGNVMLAGFDEVLNLYLGRNLTSPTFNRDFMRISIEGDIFLKTIFTSSGSEIQAAAFNPADGNVIFVIKNNGHSAYDLEGEFIEGYGFSDTGDGVNIPFAVDWDGNIIYRRDPIHEYRKFRPSPGDVDILFTQQLDNTVTVTDLGSDTFNRTYAVGGSVDFGSNRYIKIVDIEGTQIGILAGDNAHRNISVHPGPKYPLLVPPVIIPSAPVELEATQDDDDDEAVNLVWKTPGSKTIISGYRIYQDEVLIGSVEFGTNTFKAEGLDLDVEYEFYVTSFNGAGESIASNVEVITLTSGNFTDFNEYTTGVQPSDWTARFGTTTWQTVELAGSTGGKVLRSSGFGVQLRACTWDDHEFENGTIKMRGKSSTTWFAGTLDLSVVARVSGTTAGNANLYGACVDGTAFRIYKYVNGSFSQIASSSVTPASDTYYNIEFTLNGTSLQAKFYTDAQGPEGGVTLNDTDSSVTGSGHAGVGTLIGPAIYYDTFEVES